MILNQFYLDYPDYPFPTKDPIIADVELLVDDTYGAALTTNHTVNNLDELFFKPISQNNLDRITSVSLSALADACNARNLKSGFKPYAVNGKVCLWGLRLGPLVKAPSPQEIRQRMKDLILFERFIAAKRVKPHMVRGIITAMMIEAVAKHCMMSTRAAERAIIKELDCVTHEDDCGFFYLVPRWAYDLFKQKGYVHKTSAAINRMKIR